MFSDLSQVDMNKSKIIPTKMCKKLLKNYYKVQQYTSVHLEKLVLTVKVSHLIES